MKYRTACFSGPRPEKLMDEWDECNPELIRIKQQIQAKVINAAVDGYRTFMTGMARGIDIIAAEVVLELKQVLSDISLVAVIPYHEQRFQQGGWESRYERVLEGANEVIELSEHYYKGCLTQRNHYMVEHSSRLIAIINGSRGGTMSTFRYAQKYGIETDLIATTLCSSKCQ